MDFRWTDEKVKELRHLYDVLALSCSQIATEMGGGLTRNAVIGKVHRLGLEPRGRSNQFHGNQKRSAIKTKKRPAQFAHSVLPEWPEPRPFVCTEAVAVEPLHLSLQDLTHNDCRWPFGLSVPYSFCGHPKTTKWYCAAHEELSTRRAATRRTVVAPPKEYKPQRKFSGAWA